MAGLARICKLYGRMKINGVMWLWDYASDCAVTEAEMPHGSARRKASDEARGALMLAAMNEAGVPPAAPAVVGQ